MEEAAVLPRATVPICTSPEWGDGSFAGKLCMLRVCVLCVRALYGICFRLRVGR